MNGVEIVKAFQSQSRMNEELLKNIKYLTEISIRYDQRIKELENKLEEHERTTARRI